MRPVSYATVSPSDCASGSFILVLSLVATVLLRVTVCYRLPLSWSLFPDFSGSTSSGSLPSITVFRVLGLCGPIPFMQTGAFLPSRADLFIASIPRRWLLISQVSLLGSIICLTLSWQTHHYLSFLPISPSPSRLRKTAVRRYGLINRLNPHTTSR